MANNAIIIQGLIELHLKGEGAERAVASMTKILEQEKKVIEATGGIGSGAEKAGKGVESLNAQFVALGKTVAGYFAAGVIANFLKNSLLGFARTERQALALEQQIRSLGGAASDAGGLRSFIAQTSDTFGILDDDLIPAMQRAVLGFKDYAVAQEVVTLASKFAANGIGDVGTNVEKLTRFFQTGSAKSLVDFGVNVKGGEDAVLGLDEGIKALLDTAGKMPSTFNDAQKAINDWRNDLDAATDAIGKAEAGLIRLIQRGGELLGTGIDTVFSSAEDIGKTAEGARILEDLKLKAAKDRTDAESKLLAKAADEQSRRDAKKEEEKTKDAIEAEKDRLAKIADLNETSSQALIKQVASQYEEGSAERVNLELALNSRLEAAAIASAKKIGADTLAIAAFYANERGKIVASKGETKTEKGKREDLAEFDPRAGFAEVEKFAEAHQEELTRILDDGLIKRLELVRDLSPEGSRERLDAEAALQRAQLQVKADQATRAAKGQKDIQLAIAKDLSDGLIAHSQVTAKTQEESDTARYQSNLRLGQQMAGTLGSLFAKNKAFAIAMAIANTALGITEVWASKTASWYEKIAQTVIVAASGAAQIAAIRSANMGGGGGAPSATVASAPTVAATNPNTTPSSTSSVGPTQQSAPASSVTSTAPPVFVTVEAAPSLESTARVAEPKPLEVAVPEPLAVETPAPFAVDIPPPLEVETSKPIPVDSPPPLEVAVPKPLAVEAPKPITVDAPKSIAVDVPQALEVEIPKPIPVDVPPPLKVETSKPLQVESAPPIEVAIPEPLTVDAPPPLTVEPQPPLKVESQKPLVVEPPAPVKAEPIPPVKVAAQVPSKPIPVEVPKPIRVDTPKPLRVEASPPVKVETPKPVEIETHAPIKVEAPKSIKVETPKPIQVETPKHLDVEAPRGPVAPQVAAAPKAPPVAPVKAPTAPPVAAKPTPPPVVRGSPTVAPVAPRAVSPQPIVTPAPQVSVSVRPIVEPFIQAPRPITLSPLSPSLIAALSARSQSVSTTNVVNIGTAFGDRQSMTKLAREINRINANDQSALR